MNDDERSKIAVVSTPKVSASLVMQRTLLGQSRMTTIFVEPFLRFRIGYGDLVKSKATQVHLLCDSFPRLRTGRLPAAILEPCKDNWKFEGAADMEMEPSGLLDVPDFPMNVHDHKKILASCVLEECAVKNRRRHLR